MSTSDPQANDFLDRVTSPAMRQRFDELCANRPDIRTTRYMMSPQQQMQWLHSVGVCADSQLQGMVPPMPPLNLRNIVAASEMETFLWTGAVDIALFMTLYERHHSPRDPIKPVILDFGAGCGRLCRFLHDYPQRWEVHASDVNADLIQWDTRSLPNIHCVRNQVTPPLPYADGTFNLIYCLSVFTHLNETAANAWLNELHRVLTPEGTLLITTHGSGALEIAKDSPTHQGMFATTRETILDIIANFEARPFRFIGGNRAILDAAKAGEDYGNTFIHPRYIQNRWNNLFRVLEHLPGGQRGWQDVVVMQRN